MDGLAVPREVLADVVVDDLAVVAVVGRVRVVVVVLAAVVAPGRLVGAVDGREVSVLVAGLVVVFVAVGLPVVLVEGFAAGLAVSVFPAAVFFSGSLPVFFAAGTFLSALGSVLVSFFAAPAAAATAAAPTVAAAAAPAMAATDTEESSDSLGAGADS